MGCKLLKTVQTITTFRNPLADPVGTRRGPPLVRGPQFENRWSIGLSFVWRSVCLVQL